MSTSRKGKEITKMTYEDIKEIYSDIIDLWGAEDGEKIIVAVHTAPRVDMSFEDFFRHHCIACGGNWVAMVYSGLKSIAPTVAAVIPDRVVNGFKEFAALHNIAYLLGVHEVSLPD